MTDTYDIKVDQSTIYVIDKADSIYHLWQGVVVDSATTGLYGSASANNNQLIVDGVVIANYGIELKGSANIVQIGAGGALIGKYAGISNVAANQTITNYGVVSGSTYGIRNISTGDFSVENHGFISGKFGLSGDSGKITVNNGADGNIHGWYTGIYIDSSSTQPVTITNIGEITSDVLSILITNLADNIVTNRGNISGNIFLGDGNNLLDSRDGVITGNIYLGTGNDVLDFRHATVESQIYTDDGNDTIDLRNVNLAGFANGGSGDDLYLVSSSDIALSEAQDAGTDTVKSAASYTLADNFENLTLLGKAKRNATGNELDNVLTGNNGKNTIKGMAGDDTIAGGKGADKLIGGTGADVFIFANKGGHDKIMDFKPGSDSIDLSHLSAITSFSDLKQHHMSSVHGDVIITAGKDQLILDGVKIGDLHKGDFDF